MLSTSLLKYVMSFNWRIFFEDEPVWKPLDTVHGNLWKSMEMKYTSRCPTGVKGNTYYWLTLGVSTQTTHELTTTSNFTDCMIEHQGTDN